jgi:hypothetical protein
MLLALTPHALSRHGGKATMKNFGWAHIALFAFSVAFTGAGFSLLAQGTAPTWDGDESNAIVVVAKAETPAPRTVTPVSRTQ